MSNNFSRLLSFSLFSLMVQLKLAILYFWSNSHFNFSIFLDFLATFCTHFTKTTHSYFDKANALFLICNRGIEG